MVIGWNAESISSIWGWIMMALGGGVIVPNILRWYWWRTNGWGYAAGTMGGIILSLVPLIRPELPVYITFPIICAGSLLAAIIVSVATDPADEKTLIDFYTTVRPFGRWGVVKSKNSSSLEQNTSSKDLSIRSVLNTLIAIAGITGLYLSPMYFVGHWYGKAILWSAVAALSATVLYFTWYRKLD